METLEPQSIESKSEAKKIQQITAPGHNKNTMAENTEISWTTHTANLWWGCTEVHAGCDNCYARALAHQRFNRFPVWGNKPNSEGGVRRLISGVWSDLAKFQRKAAALGVNHTVFVGSMMDIFEKPFPLIDKDGVPAIDAADGSPICTDMPREQLFDKITAGEYPNLIFLLLTKRPGNINKYIPQAWKENGAPENVWFGTSVVDQETADMLIGQLLQVNGKRFLSMEPLLGPVDLTRVRAESYFGSGDAQSELYMNVLEQSYNYHQEFSGEDGWTVDGDEHPAIDWVIVGGESGPGARPMHPHWATQIVFDCINADEPVPVHFKQWGEYREGMTGGYMAEAKKKGVFVYDDGTFSNDVIERDRNAVLMSKVGKKEAGRELNGRTYDDTPLTIK